MTEQHAQHDEYLSRCRAALKAEQTHSLSTTNNWGHVDKGQVHKDWDALYGEIAAHIDGGNPQDALIQSFVKRHYEIVSRFYVPTREAYIGMSLFYESDPDMKSFHEHYHPEMIDFLGKSMQVYADRNL